MSAATQHRPVTERFVSMRWLLSFLVFTLTGCGSCYTFQGFSIDPSLTTFYVSDFRSTVSNAPPTIGQTFTESLKEKVLRESRLEANDEDPDIEFSGTVSNFRVSSVSPEPGEFAALNRLEISIALQYTNHRDDEASWSQTFSHFEDFPAQQNLLDVQDELIENIFEQILEDIFNKAFTNW
ncbi:MAG: LPS assembly lipoprotein LptE [Saprospiraceae bacterium]|nr:LPS assembly lipoprotein LptE [Saprospiraceae bacterium]